MFRESAVALAAVIACAGVATPAQAQTREELSRLMVEAYDHMEAGARLTKRAKLSEGKARYGKACAAYAKVLGGLKGLEGKVASARLRATAQVCHYNTACARAQRGEKKLALDAFARALESGYDDFRRIEKDGSLNPIRKEPRYAQLLERVKNKLARAVQRAGAQTLSSKPLFAFDFKATTLAGKKLSLKDLRGKVVIVDYWGTWCGPCKMEIPHFVKLKKEFGKRLEIVGMTWEHGKSGPKTIKMVKAFAKVLKINYPLIMLSKQADLAKVPNLRAFPTTLFIDKKGRVRAREVGYRDRASLRKLVAALDAEGPKKGPAKSGKKAPAKKFYEPLGLRPLVTLLSHPARVLGLIALVSIGLAIPASRVQVDNTPTAWLPAEDPALTAYGRFRAVFGGDTFAIVATERVDLDQAATRRALHDLGRRLQRLDVRVHTPVVPRTRVARARAELPRILRTLARAVEASQPDSAERGELMLLQAEQNASLGFLLLEAEAAVAAFKTAQRAALAALVREAQPLAIALAGRADPAPLLAKAADTPSLRAALFWWAFARGGETRARPRDMKLVRDLARVDQVMRWMLAREEGFFGGGPHLYFALRHTALGRALGGDPSKSLPHFEAARRLSQGAALPRLLQAQHHAPTLAATERGATRAQVGAAQRKAWDAFVQPLLAIARGRPRWGADPARTLADAVAQERALELLRDPEEHGLLKPEGVAPPALPALPALELDDRAPGRFLISKDGTRAGLVVLPRPDLGPRERASLMAGIEAELKATPLPLHLAGPERITHDLDQGSQRSFGGLFPVVLLAMAVVLGVALRSARVVLAILLTAGASALWTVGLLVLCGRTLNLIVVVLPAILAVLTTAYSLHLVTRFLHQDGEAGPLDRAARVARWGDAIRATVRPCLLTAVTTAAGFGSLVFSGIPPVRDLGLFAGVGALICFGLTFSLLPGLLSLSAAVAPLPEDQRSRVTLWTADRSERFSGWLERRAVLILCVAGLLALGGGLGLRQLRFESHVLRFFPEAHPLPRSYAEVEAHLLGLTPLEVWLSGSRAAVLAPETLDGLARFLSAAQRDDLVTQVMIPLARAPKDLQRPSPEATSALLRAALSDPDPPPAAAGYLITAGDRCELRVTLACRTTYSEEFGQLVERLRGALPKSLSSERGDDLRVELTGAVPLLVRTQALLVETQLRSFGVALLIVTVVLLFAYRSARLVLVSLLPNVLPILLTLGCMGFLDIPLNTATVTVAGIALGLVVDDTIHFLHHQHTARIEGLAARPAIASTLRVVGQPITTTTLAVALGFGAFVLSSFQPTHYFGLLIALTCVAALVCDLVALPALLLARRESRMVS